MTLYCIVSMYMIYVHVVYILKTCVILALWLLLFVNLSIWSLCIQRKKTKKKETKLRACDWLAYVLTAGYTFMVGNSYVVPLVVETPFRNWLWTWNFFLRCRSWPESGCGCRTKCYKRIRANVNNLTRKLLISWSRTELLPRHKVSVVSQRQL